MNVDSWKKLLKKDQEENGKPTFILLMLKSAEEKFYSKLKKYITNELGTVSQFVKKRTFTGKNPLSCASKLLIQISCKIGKAPWEMKRENYSYFKGKKVMYGALSISKGKGGQSLAFVGTTNDKLSQVYSDSKFGITQKEEIAKADFEKIFMEWAKNYYFNTGKTCPDCIIVYREGLSDQQIKTQLPK